MGLADFDRFRFQAGLEEDLPSFDRAAAAAAALRCSRTDNFRAITDYPFTGPVLIEVGDSNAGLSIPDKASKHAIARANC